MLTNKHGKGMNPNLPALIYRNKKCLAISMSLLTSTTFNEVMSILCFINFIFQTLSLITNEFGIFFDLFMYVQHFPEPSWNFPLMPKCLYFCPRPLFDYKNTTKELSVIIWRWRRKNRKQTKGNNSYDFKCLIST